MRRFALAIIAIVSLLVPVTAVQAQQAVLRIDEVDTGGYPEISITVTAPPAVAGIDVSPGFTITENGASRPVRARQLNTKPLEVMLLVDTSGSMAGDPLLAAVGAATRFTERMPPTTSIGLIGFGENPRQLVDFTTDREEIVTALGTLRGSGETALYDALAVAAAAFDSQREALRYVVLLSDGGDTVSDATLAQAGTRMRQADVGLYAVALATEESDTAALSSLVSYAGGSVVPAVDTETLGQVYDNIAAELVGRYEITYESEAWDDAVLLIALRHEDLVFTAVTTIDLPTAPTTTLPPPPITFAPRADLPAPAPYVGAGANAWRSPVVLTIGISVIFLALVLLLVPAFLPGRRGRPGREGLGMSMRRETALARVSERAVSFTERLLGGRRRQSTINRMLDHAGITLRPGEFLVLVGSGLLIGFAAGFLLAGPAVGAVLLLLALAAPWIYISGRTNRRRRDFAGQLEGTLQLIAGSLRAGYGLLQSMNTVATEALSPTSEEFGRVVIETRLGRDLIESLEAMADRVASQDLRWILQAIKIQREVGGDLAELIDTIAATIRDRQQIRRQIEALSAEGRVSALVLILLPLGLAGIISVTNPDYLGLLFTTQVGRVLLAMGTMLMIVGTLWIRRLVRVVF